LNNENNFNNSDEIDQVNSKLRNANKRINDLELELVNKNKINLQLQDQYDDVRSYYGDIASKYSQLLIINEANCHDLVYEIKNTDYSTIIVHPFNDIGNLISFEQYINNLLAISGPLATKFIHILINFIFDLHGISSPTLVSTNDTEDKIHVILQNFIDTILYAINPKYKSNFSWNLALIMYGNNRLNTIFNIMSKLIPSLPNLLSLRRNLTSFNKFHNNSLMNNNTRPLRNDAEIVIVIYDNASKNYKKKTSRGGLSNVSEASVMTQLIVVEQGDRNVHNNIDTRTLGSNFDKKIDYSSPQEYPFKLTTKENDYLKAEIKGYLRSRLKFLHTNKIIPYFNSEHVSDDTMTDGNSENELYTCKRCTICNGIFALSKLRCNISACVSLNSELVRVKANAENIVDEQEVPSKVSYTNFIENRVQDSYYDESIDIIYQDTDILTSTSDTLMETENNSNNAFPRETSSSSNNKNSEKWIIISSSEPIMVNPCGANNIKLILETVCKRYNVRGDGCDTTKPLIETLFVCSDAGAMALSVINDAPQTSQLKNIRYILGLGHEDMAYHVALLKTLRLLGYGMLAKLHSYKSPKAQQLIFSNWDFHKSHDFIMSFVRPLLTDIIVMRILKLNPTIALSDDEKIISTSADSLYTMLMAPTSDPTFNNHKFVIINCLGALAIHRKGVRNNNSTINLAGRKFLLPFFQPLNHRIYSKMTLIDLTNLKLGSDAYVALRNKYFTVDGDSYDFVMEKDIKLFLSFLRSTNKTSSEIANLLKDLSPTLKEVIFKRLNIKIYSDQSRTDELYLDEYMIALNELNNCNTLNYEAGRDTCKTLNNEKTFWDHLTPLNIYKHGKKQIKAFFYDKTDINIRNFPDKPLKFEEKDGKLLYSSDSSGEKDELSELSMEMDDDDITNYDMDNLDNLNETEI
jgi:hypothetical protein